MLQGLNPIRCIARNQWVHCTMDSLAPDLRVKTLDRLQISLLGLWCLEISIKRRTAKGAWVATVSLSLIWKRTKGLCPGFQLANNIIDGSPSINGLLSNAPLHSLLRSWLLRWVLGSRRFDIRDSWMFGPGTNSLSIVAWGRARAC